jgi:hypothetical protein
MCDRTNQMEYIGPKWQCTSQWMPLREKYQTDHVMDMIDDARWRWIIGRTFILLFRRLPDPTTDGKKKVVRLIIGFH